MKYELIPCESVESKLIEDFIAEFVESGEYCNALWRAQETSVEKWKYDIEHEHKKNEHVFAFMVDKELVGVIRITPHPNHIANGKIGFYIKPSRRKQKYAPSMIRLAEDFCVSEGIDNITAVVDIRNTASAKSLFAAGWVRSGKLYEWTNGRTAIEFQPKSFCK